MSKLENKSVIFKEFLKGPYTPDIFKVETETISGDAPANGFLVKVLYTSVDPYMRSRCEASAGKHFTTFEVGKPVPSQSVGKVVSSNISSYPVGSIVGGTLRWSNYQVFVSEKQAKDTGVSVLPNPYNLPLARFGGALSMQGLTGYIGLYMIAAPFKKGETIYISSAAGAVGQMVGQLAKREGLRVVGSVGSDAKVKYLKEELGFDEAFNYKKEKYSEAIPKYCPNGIDVDFENVGGENLDTVLANVNLFARIIVCGMISQYDKPRNEQYPIKNLANIIYPEVKIQAFIVGRHAADYKGEFFQNVSKWLAEGQIHYKEDIFDGLENAPQVLSKILKGETFGKALVKVADP